MPFAAPTKWVDKLDNGMGLGHILNAEASLATPLTNAME